MLLTLSAPAVFAAQNRYVFLKYVPASAKPISLTIQTLTGQYGCLVRQSYFPNNDPTQELAIEIPSGSLNSDKVRYYTASDQDSADGTGPQGQVLPSRTFCSPAVEDKLYAAHFESGTSVLESWVIWVFNLAITIIAQLAIWLLWFGAKLLGFLISLGSFINHPFVRAGWPFFQGLANLGFMIALVFIALTTTLNIQIGGLGWQRLLPRLFIAAILINFSLVLGGILIDISRLLMAAAVSLLSTSGGASGASVLSNLGRNLVQSSQIITSVFDTSSFVNGGNFLYSTVGSTSWTAPLHLLRATILLWGLAIGFWFAVIILFVRYVALLVLLVFSPLAYLAYAFPGMKRFSDQWWSQFLKWVFYGPIVVFLLVIASTVGGLKVGSGDPGFQSLVSVVFTIAILIMSATAGRSLGAAGANAAINLGRSSGRRVRNYAYRGTRATAGTAVRGTVGAAKVTDNAIAQRTGGYSVGRGVSSMKDYFNVRGQNKQKARALQERQRQQQSLGTYAAQTPEQRAATARVQAKTTAGKAWAEEAKKATTATDPALSSERLRSKEVQGAVNDKQLRTIVDHNFYSATPDMNQLEVVVRSSDMVGKMDMDTQNTLITMLKQRIADPGMSKENKQEASTLYKQLHQTMRDVERKAEKEADSTGKPKTSKS